MIVWQLILYCLLYMGLVKFYVMGSAVSGLYFYPEPVQERAIAIGLTDAETVTRKRKPFLFGFSANPLDIDEKPACVLPAW